MKDVNWGKIGVIQMQHAFNMLTWLPGTELGPIWSCLSSKQDKIPIIPRRKAIVTAKFTYLEKQKVIQCHCFLKP